MNLIIYQLLLAISLFAATETAIYQCLTPGQACEQCSWHNPAKKKCIDQQRYESRSRCNEDCQEMFEGDPVDVTVVEEGPNPLAIHKDEASEDAPSDYYCDMEAEQCVECQSLAECRAGKVVPVFENADLCDYACDITNIRFVQIPGAPCDHCFMEEGETRACTAYTTQLFATREKCNAAPPLEVATPPPPTTTTTTTAPTTKQPTTLDPETTRLYGYFCDLSSAGCLLCKDSDDCVRGVIKNVVENQDICEAECNADNIRWIKLPGQPCTGCYIFTDIGQSCPASQQHFPSFAECVAGTATEEPTTSLDPLRQFGYYCDNADQMCKNCDKSMDCLKGLIDQIYANSIDCDSTCKGADIYWYRISPGFCGRCLDDQGHSHQCPVSTMLFSTEKACLSNQTSIEPTKQPEPIFWFASTKTECSRCYFPTQGSDSSINLCPGETSRFVVFEDCVESLPKEPTEVIYWYASSKLDCSQCYYPTEGDDINIQLCPFETSRFPSYDDCTASLTIHPDSRLPCETTDWTEWSSCSVTCFVCQRWRARVYKEESALIREKTCNSVTLEDFQSMYLGDCPGTTYYTSWEVNGKLTGDDIIESLSERFTLSDGTEMTATDVTEQRSVLESLTRMNKVIAKEQGLDEDQDFDAKSPVFLGDTILSAEDASSLAAIAEAGGSTAGMNISGSLADKRWPTKISYIFTEDPAVPDEMKLLFRYATYRPNKETPLDFVNVKAKPDDPKEGYIVVKRSKTCSSGFGRPAVKPNGSRPPAVINLNPECASAATILQLLGRTLGIPPEHTRTDRDGYIRVNYDNVDPAQLYNLAKLPLPYSNYTTYEYGSIQHVSDKAFKQPSASGSTFTVTNDQYNHTTGSTLPEMTFYDVLAINRLYSKDACPTSSIRCSNEGYLNPSDCNECTCPELWSGKTCSELKSGNPQACGGELIKVTPDEKDMPTPNADGSYPSPQECIWLLETPDPSKKISIKIPENVGLEIGKDGRCRDAFLEIRSGKDLADTGYRLCGPEVSNIRLDPAVNRTAIILRTTPLDKTYPGFTAKVKLYEPTARKDYFCDTMQKTCYSCSGTEAPEKCEAGVSWKLYKSFDECQETCSQFVKKYYCHPVAQACYACPDAGCDSSAKVYTAMSSCEDECKPPKEEYYCKSDVNQCYVCPDGGCTADVKSYKDPAECEAQCKQAKPPQYYCHPRAEACYGCPEGTGCNFGLKTFDSMKLCVDECPRWKKQFYCHPYAEKCYKCPEQSCNFGVPLYDDIKQCDSTCVGKKKFYCDIASETCHLCMAGGICESTSIALYDTKPACSSACRGSGKPSKYYCSTKDGVCVTCADGDPCYKSSTNLFATREACAGSCQKALAPRYWYISGDLRCQKCYVQPTHPFRCPLMTALYKAESTCRYMKGLQPGTGTGPGPQRSTPQPGPGKRYPEVFWYFDGKDCFVCQIGADYTKLCPSKTALFTNQHLCSRWYKHHKQRPTPTGQCVWQNVCSYTERKPVRRSMDCDLFCYRTCLPARRLWFYRYYWY